MARHSAAAAKRGLIQSGETVIGHQQDSPTKHNPFLASIFNERNAAKSTVSNMLSMRRSKDLREELVNQRILTSLKLEAVNIKAPLLWRQKEEAFKRQRDIKNQTVYQFPRPI